MERHVARKKDDENSLSLTPPHETTAPLHHLVQFLYTEGIEVLKSFRLHPQDEM